LLFFFFYFFLFFFLEVFLFSHPHQCLVLLVLMMAAILTEVRWNLSVVLICISFMAKDVEHFFICLFAVCISSFENLFSYLPIYLVGH
jgi:hypothetical protein